MARRGSSSAVRSQMPKMSLSTHGNPGEYDRNRAPFDAPHSTGNGGIPLIFHTDIGAARVARNHSGGMADATGGNNRERKPMGDRRFKG